MVVEHNFLKKKGNVFSGKKGPSPAFSDIIDCEKPHGTIDKGSKSIMRITVDVIRSFL